MLDVAATMKRFMDAKSRSKSAAERDTFTKETKWEDWHPTVSNYFSMIPRNNWVHLSHVLRENNAPDPSFPNVLKNNPHLAIHPETTK